MELEFDKEIDAILRKARGSGTGAGVSSSNGAHLDADIIAAFAENALPQKTKLLYMEHFADCDRCRKQLSHAMLMNNEADAASVSSVSTPIVEASVPWYQSLFKTQNLALAMGALVLTFAGGLAYLVFQDNEAVTVSQITEQKQRTEPFVGSEPMASNANVNTATTSANTIANIAGPINPGSPAAANSAASGSATGTGLTATEAAPSVDKLEERQRAAETADTARAPSADISQTAPPPPPVVMLDGVTATGEDKKNDSDDLGAKRKDLELSKARKESDDRRGYRRDAPPAAAKSGPARSGPIQNQSNQAGNTVYDMPVTRRVGGKSFSNRDGAWYDSAYSGQATRNYRRSGADYQKLDSGLRSIAETLGGTVVVIWKGKAYRIQ